MRKPTRQVERRRATAAAKKQQRQKVIAFGGLGVLALMMFIQGPKLLDAVNGSARPPRPPRRPRP